MEPREKKAFEPTGLVPRSIVRTFERFRQQLLPGSEAAAIREYRISRYQVLVSARCLFTLLTIPIATNWLVSSWLLSPIIEHFWNTQQNEIFLNSYQEERAFAEMESFSEKLFFESLLINQGMDAQGETDALGRNKYSLPLALTPLKMQSDMNVGQNHGEDESLSFGLNSHDPIHLDDPFSLGGGGSDEVRSLRKGCDATDQRDANINFISKKRHGVNLIKAEGDDASNELHRKSSESFFTAENQSAVNEKATNDPIDINALEIKEKVQKKILELALYYNQQTILSMTNVAGDLISAFTLGCLFIWMKPEITILKSFLVEAIYSLSDTTKSFLLILLTDLLVGFHSPRGWETALEVLLKHFGLPENQDFVFLFVATFPVLLDTVFKYWIFRHLNKISPSTVATYHSMIE